MGDITSFSGEYRFLSNFWPCAIDYDGMVYSSTEHAYQAAKTIDETERNMIRLMSTPGKAKQAGKTITMRGNWNSIRLDVMRLLLSKKFEDPQLLKMLRDTGDVQLIEGNVWGDTFWGQCPVGVGQNNLGKILMEIRDNVFW